MKMFNWVQKKLSWGSDNYHRVSNGKSQDVFIGKDEGKDDSRLVASRERSNETLNCSMLGNILAIGTFNHGPHLPLEDYLQEEVKKNELRMVAMVRTTGTLISSRYDHPGLLKSLQCKTSIKEIVEDDKKDKKKMMELVMVERVKYSNCELLQPLLKVDKEKEERTTLADLLGIEASFSKTRSSLGVH